MIRKRKVNVNKMEEGHMKELENLLIGEDDDLLLEEKEYWMMWRQRFIVLRKRKV